MKLKLYSTSLLFLCLLFGCSEQNKIEKPEVEVASIELIPTIDKPLPLDHSKERTNEITHLMIHFISNAAVNPKDPYNFNEDRKSTRLNSSHVKISYAVFCLKKKKKNI